MGSLMNRTAEEEAGSLYMTQDHTICRPRRFRYCQQNLRRKDYGKLLGKIVRPP